MGKSKTAILSTLFLCSLWGCTISVNQIHTQGNASDVVDEDQKADADVSPNLNLQPKAI